MLRCILQALNSLSIHVTFTSIVPGAYPGESKMWLKTLIRSRVPLKTSHSPPIYRYITVADSALYNGGGRSRRRVWGGGCAPSPEKNEFLPENGGFWCMTFYFYAKIGQVNGGPPPAPCIRHCYISEMVEDR